jgi:hypothetical protein
MDARTPSKRIPVTLVPAKAESPGNAVSADFSDAPDDPDDPPRGEVDCGEEDGGAARSAASDEGAGNSEEEDDCDADGSGCCWPDAPDPEGAVWAWQNAAALSSRGSTQAARQPWWVTSLFLRFPRRGRLQTAIKEPLRGVRHLGLSPMELASSIPLYLDTPGATVLRRFPQEQLHFR